MEAEDRRGCQEKYVGKGHEAPCCRLSVHLCSWLKEPSITSILLYVHWLRLIESATRNRLRVRGCCSVSREASNRDGEKVKYLEGGIKDANWWPCVSLTGQKTAEWKVANSKYVGFVNVYERAILTSINSLCSLRHKLRSKHG